MDWFHSVTYPMRLPLFILLVGYFELGAVEDALAALGFDSAGGSKRVES